MSSTNPFVSGDTLLDVDIAFLSDKILSEGLSMLHIFKGMRDLEKRFEEDSINSLAQLVESIVVHERLIITTQEHEQSLVFENDLLDVVMFVPVPEKTLKSTIRGIQESEAKGAINSVDDLIKMVDNNFSQKDERRKIYYEDLAISNLTSAMSDHYGIALRLLHPTAEMDVQRNVADTTLRKIEGFVQEKMKSESEYLQGYFKLDVPIIFNYVLEKAKSRDDILPVALDFRETKEATAFRQTLKFLDEAVAVDDRRIVVQVIDELDDALRSLQKRVDKPSIDLDVTFPLSVTMNIGNVAKAVQNMVTRRRKRHLIFVEKLYKAGRQARSVRRQMGKLL